MRSRPTTVRLPSKLDDQITQLGSELGFTKTELIKAALLRQIATNNLSNFEEIKIGSGDFKRTGIRFNSTFKQLLQQQAKSRGVSVNSLVVYATNKTYEYYSKLLAELGLK